MLRWAAYVSDHAMVCAGRLTEVVGGQISQVATRQTPQTCRHCGRTCGAYVYRRQASTRLMFSTGHLVYLCISHCGPPSLSKASKGQTGQPFRRDRW